MKKTLLIAAAACLVMSASAAPQSLRSLKQIQIENKLNEKLFRFNTPDGPKTAMEIAKSQKAKAEGEVGPVIGSLEGASTYSMDGFFYSIFGMMYDCDYAAEALIQDDAVYLTCPVTGVFEEPVYVKADREGDQAFINYQPIYTQYNYYDYYLMDCSIALMDVDDEGNVSISESGYPLTIGEDGSLKTTNGYGVENEEGDIYYIGIFADLTAYGYGENELFSYAACFNLVPYEAGESVELPEGAEPQEYLYNYDVLGAQKCVLYNVYEEGETVYFDGLTCGAGTWVKGTVVDGQVIVPAGQSVEIAGSSYLMYFQPIANLTLDEDGYVESYDELDALVLNITENGFESVEGQMASVCYATSGLAAVMDNIVITKFEGAVAAKPSTPAISYFADYRDSYGQYYFGATLPTAGVGGEYIVPENLEFAIYADDEVMTFSAEDGYALDEDMEWFPYTYSDLNDGYDLSASAGTVTFWIYEGLFNELGIQARNTVDGETLYSNIMYIDITPDEEGYYHLTEVEVENGGEVAIRNMKNSQKVQLFDIQGRRAQEAKGLVINNGEVSFAK